MALRPEITITYSTTLYSAVENDSERETALYEAAIRLTECKKYKGVTLDGTRGGPAWSSYWDISSTNRARLDAYISAFINLARRKRVALEY